MGQVDASEVGADVAVVAAPRRSRFSLSHRNGIDAKGRVVVPSPYRAALADGGMATYWRGPALAVMTLPDWDRYVDDTAESLSLSGEADPAAILATLWRNSFEVRLDLQGRMSLPDNLRIRAGLGAEVLFVGCGDRIELRPSDESAEQLAEAEDHLETLTIIQSTHGLPRAGR